jgi:hypothetical protein
MAIWEGSHEGDAETETTDRADRKMVRSLIPDDFWIRAG